MSVVVPPHDGVKVVKLVVMLRKFYMVRSLKMPLQRMGVVLVVLVV